MEANEWLKGSGPKGNWSLLVFNNGPSQGENNAFSFSIFSQHHISTPINWQKSWHTKQEEKKKQPKYIVFPSCEWGQLASWFHNQQEVPRDNISQRFPPTTENKSKIRDKIKSESRLLCVFFLRGVNADSLCALIFYDRLNLSSCSLGGIWPADVTEIPDSLSGGGTSSNDLQLP